MKLTYRGLTYNYNPPTANVTETTEVGYYRGSSIRFRKQQETLAQQPSLDLKYRGVAYDSNPAFAAALKEVVAPIPAPVKAAVVLSNEAWTRQLTMNHHRAVMQRQQSLLTRFATQIGLDVETSFQGNIEPMVEAAYDRSHVAFS